MTFSEDIVSERFLDDVLQLSATVVACAADVDFCFLCLYDEHNSPKNTGLKIAHSPNSQGFGKPGFSLDEGLVAFVTRQEQPVIIFDLSSVTGFEDREIVKSHRLHSMFALPLKAPNGVSIGAVACFTAKPHVFTFEETGRISSVAEKVATTILNTKLMVKTRVAQEELESQHLIQRAGEVLMRRQGIGEEEAMRLIRQYCVESLMSPRRVAETILLSDMVDTPSH